MNEPLRFAILSAAHVHASAYAAALTTLPETVLTAVWDSDPERGRAFAGRYNAPFFGDLASPALWEMVDAVIITAESVRHRDLAGVAASAGKHILCEKPLATIAEDAEAMIAAAERAGVVLATAFPMRHSLPALRIKAALEAGAIGDVLAVRATNHGQLPPGWFLDPAMSGGGAVMDHTVHVLDLLRWYLRDEPTEIYAEISHGLYGLAVEDAAFLTIGFRSGVVATLDPSWSRPASFPLWGDLTMEIAGTKGTLGLNAFSQNLSYYPSDARPIEWLAWGADADRAMIADFTTAIRNRRPPAATGRDGERALAVALAAYASARTQLPVAIAPPT